MMLLDCGMLFKCVLFLHKGSPGMRVASSHLSQEAAALAFGRLTVGTLPMRTRLY